MALNHDGWDEIFSALPIIERVNTNGFFDLTAKQIKTISGREARLMAKIDFREQIPKVMKKESMAILAINNGTYRIGRFDPFIDINRVSSVEPESFPLPENIITLNPQKLAHESAVLDISLISGILQSAFGEPVNLTIRGRTRNSPFNFSLGEIQFPVSGVQIEVDGGYEGENTINLVEAKVGSRSNINVRQLIYPQLAWQHTIGGRKIVKTFVCFYQEPIIRIIPIVYNNGICSADHENELAYIIETEARLNLASIRPDPQAHVDLSAPFPQANRFETVLAMFNILAGREEISKEELVEEFDIEQSDQRHIDYYANAMKWLGLVDIKNGIVKINDNGRRISLLTHEKKLKRLATTIFKEPIFNHILNRPLEPVPANLFERWGCNSAKTRKRRIDTVRAWIKYFEQYTI